MRQFLEQAIEKENANKAPRPSKKLLDQWKKDLAKKKNKNDKRTDDFATWLRIRRTVTVPRPENLDVLLAATIHGQANQDN